MELPSISQTTRGWLSLVAGIAIGPVFLLLAYRAGLVFGLAAVAYFIVCATVVPLLTYIAGRFGFLVWQLTILSLALSVVGDNLRLKAIHGHEIASVAYVFWLIGTLLSSPLPVYLILKPMAPRRRYIVGSIILVVGVALYLCLAFLPR